MQVRLADSADRPAIRDVARRSLQASYSLGPQAITSAIEEWYDEDRLDETLSDDDHVLLVVEVEGRAVGFSESVVSGDGVGTILWIHVDPAYRGRDLGTALLEETRDHLDGLGAGRLHGRVLADNVSGNGFYEAHGFEKTDEAETDIAGRTYVENHYVEAHPSGREPVETDSGTAYVDHGVTETGSAGAFHVVYASEDGDDRHGYYCANCGSLANAMDAMGRIECDTCGNARKPTRWDAAYL